MSYRDAFEVHRRAITAHCYRMLGSLQDAEEVAQETLLRAWQSGEAAVAPGARRAWLVSVATRGCLDALRKKRRRRASAARVGEPTELTWLEPAPDALFEIAAPESESPQDAVTRREQVGLAFVVALQYLSPRQRAALLLVDVLGWRVDESAALLETTAASVNSLLQRARRTLAGGEVAPAEPADGEPQLRAFVAAWERGDVQQLVSLLAADARLWMPPDPCFLRGREAVGAFLDPFVRHAPERFRLRPTAANGRPAVAIYKRADGERSFRASAISVLRIEGGRIAEITRFTIPTLFSRFGLPDEIVE